MRRKASSAMGIGVGATEEPSLRLSVASLARVLFKHPQAEHEMLALERTATLRETEAGPDRIEAILELGDDPEVAAAAAPGPTRDRRFPPGWR